jgi:hypothetical protein
VQRHEGVVLAIGRRHLAHRQDHGAHERIAAAQLERARTRLAFEHDVQPAVAALELAELRDNPHHEQIARLGPQRRVALRDREHASITGQRGLGRAHGSFTSDDDRHRYAGKRHRTPQSDYRQRQTLAHGDSFGETRLQPRSAQANHALCADKGRD